MKWNLDSVKGIIVPIVTPLMEDELIDEAKLRRQVNFVIDNGVHGILAFGSNGEFYMVTEDEMERGLEIILDEVHGRVPVYMGIGSISTKTAVRIAHMARAHAVDGISVLAPMFIKPNDQELYGHFKTISDSVQDLPMLLYNNPGRTGYRVPHDVVERLLQNTENIIGIKDSSGDMTSTEEFIRRFGSRGFRVFGGKDTLVFGSMCHGAVGAVCTLANFIPREMVDIYEKFTAGDYVGSREAQYRINPLRLSMDVASFPVGTKDFCNIAGLEIGDPYKPNLSSSGKPMEDMRREYLLLKEEGSRAGTKA